MIQNNRPIIEAAALRAELGWQNVNDFTLEEAANSLGIHVKTSTRIKSEGRIVIKGDIGVVTIREGITLEGKRNFIIAHEIAHFRLHKNLLAVFNDTNKTLADWYRNGPQEQEANIFASALLMPEDIFRQRVAGQKLDIALIRSVSSYFGVSMTAAFLRFCSLNIYPLMIIFIDDGIIKWKKYSESFPFQFLKIENTVPAYTVAGDFFNRSFLEDKPVKVDAIEWFPEDFNCQKEPNSKIWEQCFRVSDKGLVSCLWL